MRNFAVITFNTSEYTRLENPVCHLRNVSFPILQMLASSLMLYLVTWGNWISSVAKLFRITSLFRKLVCSGCTSAKSMGMCDENLGSYASQSNNMQCSWKI